VGDEALLHAALAPTWICADRALSAKAAIADGADIIVMDDGLQNPGLYQDLPLLVIDGEQAFGNGKIIPAGPLREPVEDAIARAKAIVLIGDDRRGILGLCEGKPVFRARIDVTNGDAFKGKPVVAFAGIGRPQKFFYSLEEAGAKLAMAFPFSDHHAYTACEIEALIEQAETLKADLVTTAKDHVRLPKEAQAKTKVLQIALRWEDPQAPARLLTPVQ
jgi:tetraacyldisaccharide 4'-kinase